MILENRYRIDEAVYSDVCVVVQRGYDQVLNRTVLVERLQPQCASDPQAVARLHDTARHLATTELPHVTALYDQGEENGLPFLVFEEAIGDTIAGLAPIPSDHVVSLLTQVLETLQVAQQRGLPPPPVTPQTVRLAPDGKVQILQAGFMGETTTVAVMPVLGALLAAAVTGQTHGIPADASSVPPSFQRVVQRALANSYMEPNALLHDLRTAQQQATVATVVVPPPRPTITIPDDTYTQPADDYIPPARTRQKPGRGAIIAMLGGLLALSLLAGVLILRRPAAVAGGDGATVSGNPAALTSVAGTTETATPAGAPYLVATNDGSRLRVRRGPSLQEQQVAAAPNGSVVRVVEGPVRADGYNWVRVQAPGVDGWCVLEALRKQ